ncbi:MAG: putative toxin-antitoxin system toxin component, PIN family [Rhodospirillales bacterium RIFCSPLOWO2_02_FULL_58_16]|nr:MAG: putative toxin-antitoxin system toxin component, PIN family [Rhodospirillales bacterium RIFCSPLOWO2_02_FULL_58_16]
MVSGLAYPNSIPGRIVAAWRQGAIDVALSRFILDELRRVLPRLNHRLNWREADFADLIDTLAFSVDLIEPVPLADDIVADAADIPVLGTLLAGRADYLVTGDQDLLALAESYPIITPAEFWRRHGG